MIWPPKRSKIIKLAGSRSYEVLHLAALLLVDQGKQERAVECYALASRRPYVANSRWFEDVVGRHIAAVAERLPPEVVAAAGTGAGAGRGGDRGGVGGGVGLILERG